MVKHLGEDLDHWHTSFDRNEVLCETMWDVGKRLGKKVALINWPVTFPMGAISEKTAASWPVFDHHSATFHAPVGRGFQRLLLQPEAALPTRSPAGRSS